MIKVHTETGSVYEFDLENSLVRRVNQTGNFSPMRKDEEWTDLVTKPDIVIGRSMTFALIVRDDDLVTFRSTSYVTKVEEI